MFVTALISKKRGRLLIGEKNFRGCFRYLTKSQQRKLYQIIAKFPRLMIHGEVLLSTTQLNMLWESRNSLRDLKRLCKRLPNHLQYEILFFAKNEYGEGELRVPNIIEKRTIYRGGGRGKNYQQIRLFFVIKKDENYENEK